MFERLAGIGLYPDELKDMGAVMPALRRPGELIGGGFEAIKQGDVEPIIEEGIHQIPGIGYSAWTEGMIGGDEERTRPRRPTRARPRRR